MTHSNHVRLLLNNALALMRADRDKWQMRADGRGARGRWIDPDRDIAPPRRARATVAPDLRRSP